MIYRLYFVYTGASAQNVFGSTSVTSVTIILLCDCAFDTFLDLVTYDSSGLF